MKTWSPGEGGRLPPPPASALADKIAHGWSGLGGPPLSPETTARLGLHLHLLYRANLNLNLTGIRDPAQGVGRHVLESMEAFLLPRSSVPRFLVDLGSGNGYPGLPLLLLWPKTRGLLVESSRRKADFLRQTIKDLDLQKRVTLLESRIESEEEVPREADAFCMRGFPSPARWAEAFLARPGTQEILAWLSQKDGQVIVKNLAGRSKFIQTFPIRGANSGVILQIRTGK